MAPEKGKLGLKVGVGGKDQPRLTMKLPEGELAFSERKRSQKEVTWEEVNKRKSARNSMEGSLHLQPF